MPLKFIVSSKALRDAVSVVGRVIPKKGIVPIIENVKFQLEGNSLTLTGSDFNTTISKTIAVESGADGSLCIPYDKLSQLLSTIAEGPLTITEKDAFSVSIGHATGKSKLAGEDAGDYPNPKLPAVTHRLEFSADERRLLGDALYATTYATERKPDSTTIASKLGVLFQPKEDGLNIVGTDSHRLIRQRIPVDSKINIPPCIVPTVGAELLAKLCASGSEDLLVLTFLSNKLLCEVGGTVIRCTLVDGRYLDYEMAIPTEFPGIARIDRLSLMSAINTVLVTANQTTKQIRLSFTPTSLTVSAEDMDLNQESDVSVLCEYESTIVEPLEIGFHAGLLLEVLNHQPMSEVLMLMSSPNRAMVIKEPDIDSPNLALVMPVMLTVYA